MRKETQTYFKRPFLVRYDYKGGMITNKTKIKDAEIEKLIKDYSKDMNLEKFAKRLVARYNEIVEAFKFPYINQNTKPGRCPTECKNQDIKCIDCFLGSHFESRFEVEF